jgi:hypothetical protein
MQGRVAGILGFPSHPFDRNGLVASACSEQRLHGWAAAEFFVVITLD